MTYYSALKSLIVDEVLAEIPIVWPFVDIAVLNGAAGNGTTDDAAALQAALNTGKLVYIAPTKTYAFGSQLTIPDNGGFIGGGTLRMLTGTGKFDFADYTGTTTGKAGIFIDGKTNVTVQAKIEMQSNAAIRTCNAIWVRSSTNVKLDVEITGFKECQFGLIEWDSNVGGQIKGYVHDCGTTITTGLPSIQISALSVDNNRVSGVNSTPMVFDIEANDLTQSAGSIAAYGWQTDGVNLNGSGYGGHTGTVRAKNVGEPLDIFTSHNIVTVTTHEDCTFGVKLIHGAQHNIVTATVDRFQKAGCLISGTSTGSRDTSFNRVTLTVSGGGDTGSFSDTCAALIEGAGFTYGAHNNTIDVTSNSDGVDLDFIAAINGGNNNTIIYEGTGAAQEEARVVASGTNNRIEARRSRPITVAKLTANFPPANVGAGARHFVSDANSTTFNSVVAGGGSNIVPVRCDGTNWRIG